MKGVGFYQGIGRAFDRTGFTQSAQQTAHEGGFPRAVGSEQSNRAWLHSERDICRREQARAAAMTDDLIGLRNAVRVALIVTLAAWSNPESRGCHYRE